MNSDLIARALAVTAILCALFVGSASESCNCATANKRSNLVGRIVRWVTWLTVKDEFEANPPVQDAGALRSENSPPARAKGATGEVQIDHGHGW